MTSKTCTTCRFLVKTGGYRGRPAERFCAKRKFAFTPATTWQPIANCKYYQSKQREAHHSR